MEEKMDEKKILNDAELEKVNGGASFNVNGSNLEIMLDPGESAGTVLEEKLKSGIQVYGFSLTVEDPNNCLMNVAQRLDMPDVIGLSRRCTVEYTLEGWKKVIVKSATFSF